MSHPEVLSQQATGLTDSTPVAACTTVGSVIRVYNTVSLMTSSLTRWHVHGVGFGGPEGACLQNRLGNLLFSGLLLYF